MRLADISANRPGSFQKSQQLLNDCRIRGCSITPEGIIDTQGDVDLIYFQGEKLPVQFRNVSGNFAADNLLLTSMVGFPTHVGGYLSVNHTPIVSLDGISQTVGKSVMIGSMKLRSLSGINKHMKRVNGNMLIRGDATHLLGLIAIEGLKQISLSHLSIATNSLVNILNKYVGTGDILSCQDELIDAGFVEQARL